MSPSDIITRNRSACLESVLAFTGLILMIWSLNGVLKSSESSSEAAFNRVHAPVSSWYDIAEGGDVGGEGERKRERDWSEARLHSHGKHYAVT